MGGVAAIAGAILDVRGDLNVPAWLWIVLGFVSLSIAQFMAFHESRKQLCRWNRWQNETALRLNDHIESGTVLMKELRDLPESRWSDVAKIITRVQMWEQEVHDFLKQEVPIRSSHFLLEGFPVQYAQAGPIERATYANYMDRRLWRLGEILQEIRSSEDR
jgi:hypothetical protein